MSQEEIASSSYEASATEVQQLIMEWIEATEQFHRRYARIVETINSLQATRSQQPMANRARLRRLITLREHMSDVLMTLLLDMSGQKSSRSTQPSKPGQLYSHARLLKDLNREIDAELLGVRAVAQA